MPQPAAGRYRAVFISPHLDDAIFSCGGTIARLIEEGPVLVVNVFSGCTEGARKYALVLGEERRGEEEAAANRLGYDAICLEEADAFLRQGSRRSIRRLFSSPTAADLADLPRITGRLAEFLADVDSDTLYVPLGVGWHVDHVLCYQAALNLASGFRGRVFHYEDSPYCFIPNAVRCRLDEIGHWAEAPLKGPLNREWWESCSHYLRSAVLCHVRPRPVRWAASVVVAAYLLGLMRQHRAAGDAGSPARCPHLSPQLEDISAQEGLKLDAMMCYASQFRTLFHGRSDCEELHRDYSRTLNDRDAIFERFWILSREPNRCAGGSGPSRHQEVEAVV